ncbi:hypothetical protein FRC06_000970 [Ceratobasidium sp. 370]|nr:hypothetical protein FRC06_000970 [Ceratobasidium sp. 370]
MLEAPGFPPGLTPKPGTTIPLSQLPTLIQLEQQFITYPQSRSISGVRRTRSKLLREESEYTPPEANAGSFTNSYEAGGESDAKRRKLCRHDSTASAHTFIARVPASLRKARSLVAGNVGHISQTPTVFGIEGSMAPPIAVLTIPPQDAALARLRALLLREAKQRTDDTRLMMTAERPNSLMFDDNLRYMTVQLLLSLKGPAGDACMPLRRHLRASLETRFHAVWLFSRYAIRLQDSRFNPFLMPCGKKEEAYQRQLRGKLIQELALGCLAIAAKQEAMNYPVSHLAAGALLEALHVQELHQQCVAHSDYQYWAEHVSERGEERSSEVRVCVACVSNEICDAMGIARVRVVPLELKQPDRLKYRCAF